MINKKEILNKIKLLTNRDKLPILISSLAVVLSLYAVYNILNQKHDNVSFIDVDGSCLKKIEKDKYRTEVIIKYVDKKSSGIALSKSKKVFSELTSFVDSLKAKDKTLTTQTSKIEVLEEKTWSNKKEKYINEGYSAQMALEIASENPDSLDKIMNFASKKDNVLIDRIESYVSKQKMKTESELCLTEAIQNAKYKAKYMTEAVGNKVGKLVSVYVKSTSSMPMPEALMMKSNFVGSDEMADSDSSSIIQQSGYDMNVIVHARFEIR